MASIRHLKNPPITESIIDIKVEHATPPSPEQLLALHQHIIAEYPQKQTRRMWAGQFGVSKSGMQVATKNQIVGYAFNNTPKTQIAVCQIDGVSFSRLSPYTSWEEILPEFQKLWGIYVTQFSPRAAIRIASRYINTIEIPLATVDLGEYFETPPKTPEGIPDRLEDFVVRLVIPFSAEGLRAIVTQAIGKAGSADALAIILDIDVICSTRLAPADPEMWQILQRIRDVKNKVFFGSLKEKTVQMFEDGVKQ